MIFDFGVTLSSHASETYGNRRFFLSSVLLHTMRAYYYDNIPGDQRLPHDYIPTRPVSAETLEAINVKFWTIPPEGHEAKINALAAERGYKNRDVINCSKEGLGEVSN